MDSFLFVYTNLLMATITEAEARNSDTCICSRMKAKDNLTCWDCWKYAACSLKDYDGSFKEWQENRE
jgi:hypothetical protein